jgi:hypothetical protein
MTRPQRACRRRGSKAFVPLKGGPKSDQVFEQTANFIRSGLVAFPEIAHNTACRNRCFGRAPPELAD